MIRLIHVYGPGKILRTCQPVFNIPRQVTAVKEFEVAKADQNADAVGVVGFVLGLRLEIRTAGFDLGRTGLRGSSKRSDLSIS